jgi:hypothetical protein
MGSREIIDLSQREKLLKAWHDGNGTLGHYPKGSDYSVETAQNGPASPPRAGLIGR